MSLITFETPTIQNELVKPAAFANQPLPYNQIANPRRFEELLYSIYKLKIEAKGFNSFDSISLMSGVRDEGRDCVFFKGGKSYGTIQCKKYERNYSKEDFGLEIVKFVLYSLLDPRLIHDKSNFTYYIAVSKDFTAECRSFIDDFNNLIHREPQLSKWIATNLQGPTLASLTITSDKVDVLEVLTKIKVLKITPQDLDIELANPIYSILKPLFFEVHTVTDNSKVQEVLDILNGDLSDVEIMRQLRIGSISLQSERNTFECIENSHIPREETEELFEWIQADAKKDEHGNPLNICLLAGQAGYGKTVILKDLYTECVSNNIPVLGLKADKLYSYTLADLQKSIGVSLPVHDLIEGGRKYFTKLVVLIDQIDALSQSMSADRSYLNVFRNFIDYFINDNNIKIVMSVRMHDLHYDPSLRIYKDMKTIKVRPLTDNQILEQVKKLGINRHDLSTKLLELLKVPNHLNVFSRVAVNNRSGLTATTIQELYFELWDQKVLHAPSTVNIKKQSIKQTLYKMVTLMFQSQRISISEYQLEDLTDELRYLESIRLIKSEERQLQFFHQSFYDFVFSKQFVEGGKNLLEYIKYPEQSIHKRSAVKMIINYLRDYNPEQYIKDLEVVFADSQVLFHIKHILLSTLLSHDQPTRQELNFVLNAIKRSFYYEILFFEHANTKAWFNFGEENSLFSLLINDVDTISFDDYNEISPENLSYRKHASFNFLRKCITQNENTTIWQFLDHVEDLSLIKNLLFSVENWDNPIAYRLFEKCVDFEETDPFAYYHVLDKIAKENPDYVLRELSRVLPSHYRSGNSDRDYEEKDVLKTLAKVCPQKLFPILFESMKIDFDREVEEEDRLIKDWKYNYVDLEDKDNLHGSEFLYRLLGVCLRRTAKSHAEVFLTFYEAHKRTRYHAILRLILFALDKNPGRYPDQIFELFNYFRELNLLTFYDDIEHDLRVLFERAFPYFNDAQKKSAISTINGYVDKKEIYYRKASGTEKRLFSSSWGKSKYFWLLRIPQDVIQEDIILRRSFQELQRKFIKCKDKRRRRSVIAGTVYSPIPSKAYQFMNKAQWLQSFRQYNRNNRDRWGDDFLKGGLDELASAFQNTVKEHPTPEKLEIIQSAIEDLTIDIKYAIYGLWGWTETDRDLISPIVLLKKILERDDYDWNKSTLVTVVGRTTGGERNDPDLVKFLVDAALDYKKDFDNEYEISEEAETGIGGLISRGINTIYGHAASDLVYIRDAGYKTIIFHTVEDILSNGPSEARAAIFFRFAYLLNLDRDRAFNLFHSKISAEDDVHVIASSIWSLQYLRHYGLQKLIPAYEKLIDSQLLGREDSHMLFSILYFSYLHNHEGAFHLLSRLLLKDKNAAAGAINDIMKYYYAVPNSKEKNDMLLEYILDTATEEDFENLNWSFIHAEHLKLVDIYTFMKRYVASPYFRMTEYFVEYLILQCSHSPFGALEIFNLALSNNRRKTDRNSGIHIDEAVVKFIVGAFDALNGNDEKSKRERKKLLNAFDTVLKDFRFRKDAEKILEQLV
jgi:hypothetical protein